MESMARHRASGHTIRVPRGLWQVSFSSRQHIWIGYAIIRISSGQHSTRMPHIRIGERAAIPPKMSHIRMELLRRHSTRMSPHPDGVALPTFHPDVSYSAHSIRIFCIQCMTPDGRGGRFNFPSQTYPDHLIAFTWRVSQPFCTVPWCSLEASRYVRPTF